MRGYVRGLLRRMCLFEISNQGLHWTGLVLIEHMDQCAVLYFNVVRNCRGFKSVRPSAVNSMPFFFFFFSGLDFQGFRPTFAVP